MNTTASTYEGVVNEVAGRLFPYSDYVKELEDFLWSPPRASTVYDAILDMKKFAARYLRLCVRCGRQVAIVNVRVVEAMLAVLPRPVEDELRLQGRDKDLAEIVKHASVIEAEFARRKRVVNVSARAPVFPATVQPFPQTRLPVAPCHGCGDTGHWKKGCPYREHRCDNCNKIGHISRVCRSLAMKDSHGRIRQRVIPGPSKITTESAVDRNMPDRVGTARDELQQIAQMCKGRSEKAKAVRDRKREEKGGEPKRKVKEHPALVGVAEEEDRNDVVLELIVNMLTSAVESEEDSSIEGRHSTD
eukprot:GHVQ01039090.1.p1 GENE.GHVQ01039090.1~~GHVQ01039090.1.p1  ORF type:complete len:303 (+),score=53.04 GHVQ01039090.1:113-1021(+)